MTVPFRTAKPYAPYPVSPDIEVHIITGTVIAGTTKITSATAALAEKPIIDSALADAQLTFGASLPIVAPDTANKTLIRIDGHQVAGSNDGAGDVAINNENTGHGSILIDWEERKISGFIAHHRGNGVTNNVVRQFFAEFPDATDEVPQEINGIQIGDTPGTTYSASTIALGTRSIVALPTIPHVDGSQRVSYTVTHFKGVVGSQPNNTTTHLLAVTSLPAAPANDRQYLLLVPDVANLAPPGIYFNDGSGWKCLACNSTYELPSWTGVVGITLIVGVDYTVEIAGNVTALNLTMSGNGSVAVLGENPDGYVIAKPTDAYGLGGEDTPAAFEGLGFSNPLWSLYLQQTSTRLLGNCLRVNAP